MNKLLVCCTTINEIDHIRRWITNLQPYLDYIDIVVYDAGSIDGTLDVLSQFNITVRSHLTIDMSFAERWSIIYSEPANSNRFIFRLDADEVISPSSFNSLITLIRSNLYDVISCERRIFFEGSCLSFGKTTTSVLRCAYYRSISYQNVPLDESIIPISSARLLKSSIIIDDIPLLSLQDWLRQHISYAVLESTFVLKGGLSSKKFSLRLYYLSPPFIRPFLLFFLRYFIFLGFRDGLPGLRYQLCHSILYRLFVDLLIYSPSRRF